MREYKKTGIRPEGDLKVDLNGVIKLFDAGEGAAPFGNGHINDTYFIPGKPGLILQRINTNVFREPEKVMSNIEKVTAHLRREAEKRGGDPDRETLSLIPAKDGKSFVKTPGGEYFRMYSFISGAVSFETADDLEKLYEAGRAFGRFQLELTDFAPGELFDTIPHFHDTPARVAAFHRAIERDAAGRRAKCEREIEGFKAFEKYASLITDAIEKGEVPERVTHNDTKLNNVLFDEKTGKALCVVDLDTVMKGSLLYDYGDGLRTGASSADEDERDLSKVYFDLHKFEKFTAGFLSETADLITDRERELMHLSALIMTFECGIRFLTDWLDGDVYFKVHREGHNLDRARTQLKLTENIESKLGLMRQAVRLYASM